MPEALLYAVAYAMTAVGVTAAVTSSVIAFLITYGAATAMLLGGLAYSSISASRAKKNARDQYNAAQVDRLVNVSSAVATRELVMGRVRKAGAIFYKASTGDFQKDLYFAIALAAHEIDAVEAIYLNDVLVEMDASGHVTTEPYSNIKTLTATAPTIGPFYMGMLVNSIQAIYTSPGGESGLAPEPTGFVSYQYTESKSNVQIFTHLGQSGQTADAELIAAFPSDWTSANTVQGVAYLVVKLTYSEAAFPSGIPNVTAIIRGAKLYDPRTGTTAWSENPALMMRHVYAHSKFGKAAITATEDARFMAAANACDMSTVYTVDGVVQPATSVYKASIVLPYGADAKSAFDDLSQAMGGSWAFAGGELYLKPGVYTGSVLSLGDEDLAVTQINGTSDSQSPIKISVHKERAQKFNTVKAKIWDHAQDYKQVSLTPLVGTALLARDGAELVQEVGFAAVGYAPQALHIAGIMMRDARDALVVELPFKLRAYPLELFDTVDLTLSRYGWANKTFTILSRDWAANGALSLLLKETSASITQMDAGFLPQGFATNTNLPKPWIVATVGALMATSGPNDLIRQHDGSVIGRMRISWPQMTDISVLQGGRIEVQYRLSDSTGEWTTLYAAGDETQVFTSDIIPGAYYLIRARARTTLAVGDWGVQIQCQAGAETTAPAAPTSLAATGGLFQIALTWSLNTGTRTDIRHTEIWAATSNNRATAALLTTAAWPLLGFTHIGLAPGQTWWYWARLVDTSANASTYYPAGATAGIAASPSADPSALLAQLKSSIGLQQLATELATPILQVPDAVTSGQSAVESVMRLLLKADELKKRSQVEKWVTDATSTIDPATGKVTLLATAALTTDVEAHLNQVDLTLGALDGSIISHTSTLNNHSGRIDTAETSITQMQGSIALKVNSSYVDGSINAALGAIDPANVATASQAGAEGILQTLLDADAGRKAAQAATPRLAVAEQRLTAHAEAIEAEAVFLQVLAAQVGDNAAAVLTEQTARVTAVSAEASARTTLAARVTTAESGVASNAAFITSEASTRGTADGALASRATNLEAAVTGINGTLATKASIAYTDAAKADAISAAASTTATVQAQLNTGGATKTAIDAAQGTANTAVNNAATAQSTANTAVSNASSVATTVSQVQARLDTGDYAVVKTQASATANKVGVIEAKYAVKVDVNGHVTGFELIQNGAVGSFVILADKFLIAMPDGSGTPKQVLMLGTVNGTPALGLDGNLIVDGSIVARALAVDSVTAQKIKAGEITADKLATKTITAASGVIGDLAVDTLQIAGNAATTSAAVAGPAGTISTNLWVPAGQTMRIVALGYVDAVYLGTSIIYSSLNASINGTAVGAVALAPVVLAGGNQYYYRLAATVLGYLDVSGGAAGLSAVISLTAEGPQRLVAFGMKR